MTTTVIEVPRKKRQLRRTIIALAIVVILLVVAFFVADYFAKKIATNYVRDHVASSLGLSSTTPVTVDLGTGSILLQAVRGSLDNVEVSVDPIVLDGLSGSAKLTAHGVPLNQTTPVKSMRVLVVVPTSTVSTALTRVPSIAALKPTVKISGSHAVVTGTLSILGFPQSIGATLTPTVTKGEPGFTIDSASFDGASVSASALDRYLPGLTAALQSGKSLCIASQLPKAFTLTGISLRGQSIVSTFNGDGATLNPAAISQKGTCP